MANKFMDALGPAVPVKWRNVWEFYQDPKKDWRWRVTDEGNHEPIGASTEGYRNLLDCEYNALRMGWDGVSGKHARLSSIIKPLAPTK